MRRSAAPPAASRCAGVYPAAFWLEATGRIESLARACVTKHATVREAPQTRLWSFCAERLGSWLLLQRLRAEPGGRLDRLGERLGGRRWAAHCRGQLNLIVDEVHAGYRAGS